MASSSVPMIDRDGLRPEDAQPVVELRQYKIVSGKRDELIGLFEREFVESQEAAGMRLVGQFRDLEDPNRFTWIRGFSTMAARARALTDFYSGPVWEAHRGTANPLLEDNDNVLLLRPAAPGLGFPDADRPTTRNFPAGLVIATIHYLWKNPEENFTAFFRSEMVPVLIAAGLTVVAAYVPELKPNNFPRLPVRQGEKVFVWFARMADQARLLSSFDWLTKLKPQLEDFEERSSQVLTLLPTDRSRLR